MDLLHSAPAALDYIWKNPTEVLGVVQTHLKLSLLAVLIGAVIGLLLGVVASRSRWVSLFSLNTFGILRAIPSIAILFIVYPYLGPGFRPALFALAALACPPILINTNAAFRQVDPSTREAAYGMGMTTLQVLGKIELPLALPIVIAGIRTATVDVIASATLATFIGAGGLGDYITAGLNTFNTTLMLVGAIPVAVLTLGAELLLGGVERFSLRSTGQMALST